MERTVERTIDNVWDGKMDLDEMLDRYMASDKFEFIPAVGRKVYVVSVDDKTIAEETVYALGRESFIVDRYYLSVNKLFSEFRYDDYYKRWFLTLEEAKKHLEPYLTDDEIIEKGRNLWWVKPF